MKIFIRRLVSLGLVLFLSATLSFQDVALAVTRTDRGDEREVVTEDWDGFFKTIIRIVRPPDPDPKNPEADPYPNYPEINRSKKAGGRDAGQKERNRKSGY
jgi:hypothetical protein